MLQSSALSSDETGLGDPSAEETTPDGEELEDFSEVEEDAGEDTEESEDGDPSDEETPARKPAAKDLAQRIKELDTLRGKQGRRIQQLQQKVEAYEKILLTQGREQEADAPKGPTPKEVRDERIRQAFVEELQELGEDGYDVEEDKIKRRAYLRASRRVDQLLQFEAVVERAISSRINSTLGPRRLQELATEVGIPGVSGTDLEKDLMENFGATPEGLASMPVEYQRKVVRLLAKNRAYDALAKGETRIPDQERVVGTRVRSRSSKTMTPQMQALSQSYQRNFDLPKDEADAAAREAFGL